MLIETWCDLGVEECRTILPIGFDVGIQIVFNPKGIYKRIRLVVSVLSFTVARTKCKDGVSEKTESPGERAKSVELLKMSERTSAGEEQGPSTVDTRMSELRGTENFGSRRALQCPVIARCDDNAEALEAQTGVAAGYASALR